MTPEKQEEREADEAERLQTGRRRRAREMALQMLYQRDLAKAPIEDVVAAFDLASFRSETSPGSSPKLDLESFEYARRLVVGAFAELERIDAVLAERAVNWRVERMPAVDRNILRLAVYELSRETDVPRVVVIDEAIELAKRFGSEQSGSFVNGLLDSLREVESLR